MLRNCKRTALALVAVVGLGCTADFEVDLSAEMTDQGKFFADNSPTRFTLGGPLLGTLHTEGISCQMYGDYLDAEFEFSDGISVINRPNMQCVIDQNDIQFRFHCRGEVTDGFFTWHDDFTVVINMHNEQISGTFTWWSDWGHYFTCTSVFWIKEMEIL